MCPVAALGVGDEPVHACFLPIAFTLSIIHGLVCGVL